MTDYVTKVHLAHLSHNWYKSRRFFIPLFQLLPIIGFMTPPLSKSHVIITVSNTTRTPHISTAQATNAGVRRPGCEATCGELQLWYHRSGSLHAAIPATVQKVHLNTLNMELENLYFWVAYCNHILVVHLKYIGLLFLYDHYFRI